MLESTALSRPPVAYGKRPKHISKLPKLEWQPPAPQHIPQHGSIDPLSVVEWSTAAAPPSKVEFALGPPVLRPSELEPEGEAPAGELQRHRRRHAAAPNVSLSGMSPSTVGVHGDPAQPVDPAGSI